MREKKQRFYGWTIVALVAYVLAFTSGIHFFVFPVYVPSIVSHFETTITILMISVPVAQIFFGISSPILGQIMGRVGVKKVFVGGILLASLTNLLYSLSTEIWHFYFVSILNGISMAATTFLPCQTIISIWFNKKRGTAMGMGMVGLGVGGFIFPQLAAFFIQYFSDWIEVAQSTPFLLNMFTGWFGELNAWRGLYRLASFGYLFCILPPVLYWMKNYPSEVNQHVDGASIVVESVEEEETEITLKTAVKTPTFWLLFTALMLQIFFVTGIELNLPNFASQEAGYNLFSAVQFVAFSLFVSIPMRFVVGYLCDHYNPKWFVLFAGLGNALSVGTLLFLILENGMGGTIPIYLFALIFGTASAMGEVGLPIFVGRCFGGRHFPEIMGQMLMGAAIGGFFGPVLISFIYDTHGSYELALWALLAVSVVSAIVIIPTKVVK